MYNLSLQ